MTEMFDKDNVWSPEETARINADLEQCVFYDTAERLLTNLESCETVADKVAMVMNLMNKVTARYQSEGYDEGYKDAKQDWYYSEDTY